MLSSKELEQQIDSFKDVNKMIENLTPEDLHMMMEMLSKVSPKDMEESRSLAIHHFKDEAVILPPSRSYVRPVQEKKLSVTAQT